MYRYFQESRKVTFHAKVTSMSNRLPQCRLAVQEWIWHIRICQIKKKAKDKEKKKKQRRQNCASHFNRACTAYFLRTTIHLQRTYHVDDSTTYTPTSPVA